MKIGVVGDGLPGALPDVPGLAARLGVEGVQLGAMTERWNLCGFDAAGLAGLLHNCRDSGVELTALCGDVPGFGFDVPDAIPGRLAATRRILECAEALQVPVVTSHVGVIPAGAGERRRRMVEAMRRVGEDARKRGVVWAIETGPETAATLRDFLAEADSPGLGVNLDPANLVMVQCADVPEAVRQLGEYIVHTHAKDGRHLRSCDPERIYHAFAAGGFPALLAETGELFREEPLGQGEVPWVEYLAALRKTGYDGWLTIEREVGRDPLDDIRRAVEFLRYHIGK